MRAPATVCPTPLAAPAFKVDATHSPCAVTLATKVDYVVRRRPIGGMRPDLQKLIYHTSSDHFSELVAAAAL